MSVVSWRQISLWWPWMTLISLAVVILHYFTNFSTCRDQLCQSGWNYTHIVCKNVAPKQFLAIHGGPQKWHHMYALTLPNINRFSKLFHCQNAEKICNNTLAQDPTIPQVCRYTTLWNVKCLKSNNWKRDFCNNTLHILLNYQQGTTCLLSQLLSK